MQLPDLLPVALFALTQCTPTPSNGTKQPHVKWDREISHDGFSGRCSESQLTTCGENVAFNRPPQLTTTVGNTHISWMDSPGHRDNILNSRFNVVGYGWYVCEANDSVYWTGFFAAR